MVDAMDDDLVPALLAEVARVTDLMRETEVSMRDLADTRRRLMRQLRDELGVSQKVIAEAAGISPGAVGHTLAGGAHRRGGART